MLARTALGVGLLAAILALGAAVTRLRRSGQPVVRGVAERVHGVVGVVAIAFVAVLVVSAIRLVAS